MPSFEDIGLREELLQTLEDDEIAAPTALQQAVIPTLRRGGNLVARASSGSGKTLAYALGILDRIQAPSDDTADGGDGDDSPLRLLILTPTASEAERVGITVTRYADPLGLRLTVIGTGWGTSPSEANLLVAAAGDIMDVLRSSELKLDGLEAIVIDGGSSIAELGHWEDVDSVMDLLPREAQRVLITTVPTEAIEDLAARRVKRALRYPAEAALPDRTGPATTEGTIGYVMASEREKLDLLATQLRGREPGSAPPILFCRTDERAAALAEQLAVRGFFVGSAEEPDADAVLAAGGVTLQEIAEELEGDPGQTISYDVPSDVATMRARHAGDEDAVVLVEPRELAHLREIARMSGYKVHPAPLSSLNTRSLRELKSFRDEIRAVVGQEDLTPQMLVLEPLLQEFSAVELAAALAVLVRRKARPGPAPQETAATPAAPREKKERSTSSTGSAPVTWARLFVSIGSRDDIKPGDLVGGLAGEANIPGSRIGKIEIRDTFSIVEVQSEVADQVIRAVNGTTLKGRSVRVDYDRGGPALRPDPRGGAARRTTRRPPR